MTRLSAPSVSQFFLRKLALSVAVVCGVVTSPVYANGVDPSVVVGTASFTTNGSTLDVLNSPGAVIHWQGFSIGADETTNFIQQNANSSVLNRVMGSDPSVILGTLTSNGRVFLINPSGILVGQGARIDVAGLVASSLNITDADYAAGQDRFVSDGFAGSVENRGGITTPSGGSVYLIGRAVTNSGIITSPGGDVILAAGEQVDILDTSTPGVRVEITASDNLVVNLGEILAKSGEIGIYGAALRNAGVLDASEVVRNASGKIVLRAKQNVTLDHGSSLSVSGVQAGEITIQSETGLTSAAGSIEAVATGLGEAGGSIHVLGEQVTLAATKIDASGEGGGGTILVGGDFHGAGSLQTSNQTTLEPGVVIHADSLGNGDGGEVAIWSNDNTVVAGMLTARGGLQGGDGGLIETSGKYVSLDQSTLVNTLAPKGGTGLWLLDPVNWIIAAAGGDETPAQVTTSLASANRQIDATNDITVEDAVTWTTPQTLTLNAGHDVLITGAMTASTIDAGIVLIAGNDITTVGEMTATAQDALIDMTAGRDISVTTITTSGGGSMILRADNNVTVNGVLTADTGVNAITLLSDVDGSGPGAAAGTVNFVGVGAVVTPSAVIRFNPDGYVNTTSEIAAYQGKVSAILDAKARVFVQGNNRAYDATSAATLAFKGTPTDGGDVSLVDPGSGATFSDKNAATSKTITYAGFTIAGTDSNLFDLFGGGTGTTLANITPRSLTSINLIGTVSKPYDGNNGVTNLTAANYSISGFVGGEGAIVNNTLGTYDNGKDVVNNPASSAVTSAILVAGNFSPNAGTLLGNYDLTNVTVSATGNIGSITPISLTSVNLIGTVSKPYDGNNSVSNLTAANYSVNGFLAGEGATVANSVGTYVNGKDVVNNLVASSVASAILVAGNYAPNAGTLLSNYNLANVTVAATGNIGSISRLAVVGSISAANELYSGSTVARILARSLVGSVAGDDVSYSGGTAQFASKDVGNGIAVTGTGLAVVGADAANYTVNSTALTTANITPTPLGISAGSTSKTYGSLLTLAGSEFTSSGLQNGETVGQVSLNSSGLAATANVISSPYSIVPSAAVGGTFDPNNYVITYNNGVLNVLKAPLGVAANGATRVYGSGNPVFGVTYSGFQNGETSSVLGGTLTLNSGTSATSAVGTYGIVPAGLTSNNYTINFVNGNLGITRAPLGIAANSRSKVFGDTFSFAGTEFTTIGLKNSETIETVTLVSAGLVSTAGVAESPYPIIASNATGGTFNAGNYAITYVDGSLGVIPAGLVGIAANSAAKTYDGLPYSGGNGVSYTGFQGTDSAASLDGSLVFAGTSQGAVNVGNYSIIPGGQTSPNYTIVYFPGNLNVVPVPLGIAANSVTRLYGQVNPVLDVNYSGFQNGETAAVLGGLLSITTDATVESNVGTYSIVPSGLTSSNYTIEYVPSALGITRAPLGIVANSMSRLYGSANPAFSANYTGFQNGESQADLIGTLTLATDASTSADVGSYTITPNGQSSTNYTIEYVDGTLAVTPAPLLVTAGPGSKVYGEADPVLQFEVEGLVDDPVIGIADTALSVFSGALTRTPGESVGSSPYLITAGTLAANSNYAISDFSGNTFSVSPAPLSVIVNSAEKIYGSADPVFTFVTNGLINDSSLGINDSASNSLSGNLSRDQGESVLSGPYLITQGTLTAGDNYRLTSVTTSDLTITPATLKVNADPQSKIFGEDDPIFTFTTAGLINNQALGVVDTESNVLSNLLDRDAGESALASPYAITQGSLVANGNYDLIFAGNQLTIIGAATEPVIGFDVVQFVFADVITYYRPGNFWHISFNLNNADPGFDVMRGTSISSDRYEQSCNSVSVGGFCETWSFPEQRVPSNEY